MDHTYYFLVLAEFLFGPILPYYKQGLNLSVSQVRVAFVAVGFPSISFVLVSFHHSPLLYELSSTA